MAHRWNVLLALTAAASLACDPLPPETTPDAGDAPDAGEVPDAGTPEDPRVHPCGDEPPAPDDRPLPVDVRNAAPDLELVGGTSRLEIYARRSSPLTAEQIANFEERACAAFGFNLVDMDVDLASPKLKSALRVVVLNTTAYNQASGAPGTYGVSIPAWDGDGDAFVVPKSGLSNPSELDDTLAHELNHILVGRFAPNDAEIPWWNIEGLAISIGTRFGRVRTGEATGFAYGWLRQADGSDAELTFQRYDLEDLTTDVSQIGHDQSLSGGFVEHLRGQYVHGDARGFPDTSIRFFQTMIATSNGRRFSAAFAEKFGGVTLGDAKAGWVTFLNDTAGNTDARFAGTVWDPETPVP